MPTASRPAVCSLTTPEPAYSSGIDQPPNSASLAPRATCRSWSGEVRSDDSSTGSAMARTYRSKEGLPPSLSRRRTARVRDSPSADTKEQAPLTSYTLRKGSPDKTRADVVVIGVVRTAKGLQAAPGGERVASAYGRTFAPLLSTIGFTGKVDEVAKVPTAGAIRSPL